MQTKPAQTAPADRVANNINAAKMILPHFAPYGITFLKDREAIAEWMHKHWGQQRAAADLPKTLTWAVGITNCDHLKLDNNLFCSGDNTQTPGLFSLSSQGNCLEWTPGSNRPARRFGQPVQVDYHFCHWMTINNSSKDAPFFPCLHDAFSHDFCAGWTIAQASRWNKNL
jgi:hypothetical protein